MANAAAQRLFCKHHTISSRTFLHHISDGDFWGPATQPQRLDQRILPIFSCSHFLLFSFPPLLLFSSSPSLRRVPSSWWRARASQTLQIASRKFWERHQVLLSSLRKKADSSEILRIVACRFLDNEVSVRVWGLGHIASRSGSRSSSPRRAWRTVQHRPRSPLTWTVCRCGRVPEDAAGDW